MIPKKIKHIVIAGGAWGAWFTALAFIHAINDVSITVIGSSKIPGTGVGEALGWNAPHTFSQLLGMDKNTQREFVKKTGALYKQGVTYENLMADNTTTHIGKIHNLKTSSIMKHYGNFDANDYYQPSSILDTKNDFGTIEAWLWDYKQSGCCKTFEDFQVEMNDATHFVAGPYAPYDQHNRYILREDEGYTYHMDADKSFKFLRQLARDRTAGTDILTEIDAVVKQVVVDNNNEVEHLVLDNGQIIAGDVYIDMTGWRRVLTKGINNTSWRDSSKWSCDSAMFFPLPYTDPDKQMIGASLFKGQDHGWGFKINLYHRTGNGYVFKRDCADDSTIIDAIHQQYGDRVNPAGKITWEPGYYLEPWQSNVVPMGLASGFVDPFDGGNVAYQSRQLRSFIKILVDNDMMYNNDVVSQYNNTSVPAADEIYETKNKLIFGLSNRSGNFWDLQRRRRDEEHLLEEIEDILSHNSQLENKYILNWGWYQQYVRMAIQVGLDISKFNIPKPTEQDYELAKELFRFNRARNKYISQQSWPTCYQWHKENIFDNKTSEEVWTELNQ